MTIMIVNRYYYKPISTINDYNNNCITKQYNGATVKVPALLNNYVKSDGFSCNNY